MTGKSPPSAPADQRAELALLANSRERGEADRARALLLMLTLVGLTSGRIVQAFGVREGTVRPGRSDFMRGGVEVLKATVAQGPSPVKTAAVLRVATPLLTEPVAAPTCPTGRFPGRAPRSGRASASVSASRSSPKRCEKALRAAPPAHAGRTSGRRV